MFNERSRKGSAPPHRLARAPTAAARRAEPLSLAFTRAAAAPPIGAPGAMPQTSAIAPVRTLVHRTLPASSFKVLHSFDGDPDGEAPGGGLNALYDVNDTLYGTTFYGGTLRVGTVYSVSTDGAEKVLHSFGSGSDGIFPFSGLLQLSDTDDETQYGTTRDGGTSDKGTVYSIRTDGTERVLHSFGDGSDGAKPFGALTDVYGTLYGTTSEGGTSDKGTVYSIGLDGKEKVLHSFGGGSDGARPVAGLTGFSTLYGTTDEGGTSDKGIVFSIRRDGTEKVLYSFQGGSDGAHPEAGLTLGYGKFFGTTGKGGTSDKGTVYSVDTDGTEKVLHSFGGGSDGDGPYTGLIDVNGTLYGTTFLGGSERCFRFGCGTVYSISTDGKEKVLYTFAGYDGAKPEGSLLHHNGTLYGTTSMGGTYDRGTVYALTP